MIGDADNGALVTEEGAEEGTEEGEDYAARVARDARWELARVNWADRYFELIFRPFEAIQKISQKLLEIHGRQLQEASAYWREVEATGLLGVNGRLIREAAYFMWEMAGRPSGRHEDFWNAAQKYVASLMALGSQVSTHPDIFLGQFSPGEYYYRVQVLAEAMSRRAGQQVMTPPIVFWLAAEDHILAMLAGVATAVRDYQDATNYLNKIASLSTERYLRYIEEGAYFIWESAGKPGGAALENWLESERATLERIRREIDSSPLGPDWCPSTLSRSSRSD